MSSAYTVCVLHTGVVSKIKWTRCKTYNHRDITNDLRITHLNLTHSIACTVCTLHNTLYMKVLHLAIFKRYDCNDLLCWTCPFLLLYDCVDEMRFRLYSICVCVCVFITESKKTNVEINYSQRMWIYLFACEKPVGSTCLRLCLELKHICFCYFNGVLSFSVNEAILSIFHLTFSLQSNVYVHRQWQCQWQKQHQR